MQFICDEFSRQEPATLLKKYSNIEIILLITPTFSNQLLFPNTLEQLHLLYIHFN